MAREKTYQEMAADRQKEWSSAQRRAAAAINAVHNELSTMPDVAEAPAKNEPWAAPGIECECGSTGFVMRRWVTVNGIRHRCEVSCLGCKAVKTWDWRLEAWI